MIALRRVLGHLADVRQLAWTVEWIRGKQLIDLGKGYPHTDRWLQQLARRPAYQAAAADGLHAFATVQAS